MFEAGDLGNVQRRGFDHLFAEQYTSLNNS
jgi:hypothetical protein